MRIFLPDTAKATEDSGQNNLHGAERRRTGCPGMRLKRKAWRVYQFFVQTSAMGYLFAALGW
jgi:hypothetical protein